MYDVILSGLLPHHPLFFFCQPYLGTPSVGPISSVVLLLCLHSGCGRLGQVHAGITVVCCCFLRVVSNILKRIYLSIYLSVHLSHWQNITACAQVKFTLTQRDKHRHVRLGVQKYRSLGCGAASAGAHHVCLLLERCVLVCRTGPVMSVQDVRAGKRENAGRSAPPCVAS